MTDLTRKYTHAGQRSFETVEEANEVLRLYVRYKPGVTFSYHGGHIRLDATVMDCHKGRQATMEHTVELLLRDEVALPLTRESITYTVSNLVRRFEAHEMDEWLRWANKPFNDPHPEHKQYDRHRGLEMKGLFA